MTRHITRLLLLSALFLSCSSQQQPEEIQPDNILIVELSGAPQGGLEWLVAGHEKLPLPNLQNLCRQGLWIEPAKAGKLDLSPILRQAQENGCLPGFFGEQPALRPTHAWSLAPIPPFRALPEPAFSPKPPVQLAEQGPGMTAAIEVPMTRPHLLQLGDGAAHFFRQMALAERPWIAHFRPGDWVASQAEADALDRARRVLPEQAPALATWLLQDDALARMLSELVSIEQDGKTLVIVKGSGPDSPLLVYWPGRFEGGGKFRSPLTAQKLLQELCQQAQNPATAAGISMLRIDR